MLLLRLVSHRNSFYKFHDSPLSLHTWKYNENMSQSLSFTRNSIFVFHFSSMRTNNEHVHFLWRVKHRSRQGRLGSFLSNNFLFSQRHQVRFQNSISRKKNQYSLYRLLHFCSKDKDERFFTKKQDIESVILGRRWVFGVFGQVARLRQ